MTVALACNKRLDDINDFLLLVAGKSADQLKNLLGFTHRAAFAFWLGVQSEKFVSGNLQSFGELDDVIWTKCNGAAFPSGVCLLCDANHFGEMGLRKALLLANGTKPLAERRSFYFGWASSWHADIIRVITGKGVKRLHSYK